MGDRNKGYGIIALMCLGIFVCMIDTTIMNIALPAIQSGLHVSLEIMSWILNIYTMSIAVLSIPLARVAEIFGKGKFFIFGCLIFAIGSASCGLAQSGLFLIGARFIQSVGAAILMPVSMIIGVSAVPVERRHLAQGLLGGTQGLAAALGPAVGGIITQTLGWSWVFYVNVPICFLAITLGFTKLQLKNESRQHVKIDFIGFVLSGLTIFSLTLALIKGNTWGWNSTFAWICYVSCAALFILFIVVERKVKDPLINLTLFSHRQFNGATLAMILATVYMVSVTVLLPLFLTHFQGKTEIQAALFITPVSATIFFIAPISGILARKIGNFLLIASGFLSLGVAYFLLEQLKMNVSGTTVIAICILLGAGFGFIIGPATTASAADFEGEILTASQSVTQMFREIGVVLAVAIAVSGLTHFLSVQKQEILQYATTRTAMMNVPEPVKATVLDQSKKIIEHSDMSEGDTPNQAIKMTQTQMNPQSKQMLLAKVNIEHIHEQINTYSTDMNHYAKTSMVLAFAKLYRLGFPIVLASILISMLFMKKRPSAVHNAYNLKEYDR